MSCEEGIKLKINKAILKKKKQPVSLRGHF